MTTQHIALNGQSVPDALHERMCELQQSQSRYRNPFFHPDFINAVSGVQDNVHLFWEEDDQGLVFFWAMQISRLRTGRGIGGPFADRNGPILREGIDLDVKGFLAENNIRKFVTNGFVHDTLNETDSFETILNNEAFIETTYEDFYDTQKSEHNSQFKRWRRAKRQLENEFENVEFNFDDRSDENFKKILEMKQSQYVDTGLHNVLGPEWSHELFSRLRMSKDESFRLRVITLRVDGVLVAGEINLQSQDTLHGWIVVYDREYRKYCPGYLIVLYILEQLKSHGLSYYDFGPGSEHYAKYLTNHREAIGVGTIRSQKTSKAFLSLLESTWRLAEKRLPEKLAHLFQKTRRRFEQIIVTDTEFMPRLRGVLHALRTKD